ncbi:uncharacterized protein LOC124401128 isoform X1 [Silurus meridionalis]|uniref:uncharacterized protein LOC124401128 isoform X1 n=1 Tax=Silurus meridionalis TaxID=175797 RepID=UPI001EEA5B25|nr:uncharacterized protein LOC124401128 isoform X1 [Silurus meridionalis]
MMKCLYLLSVVFQMAAGCALFDKNLTEITQHKGRSVLLPCSCSDLHSKPQKFTWMTFRTGHWTEVLNDEHYRGRYQLFNNISPANLSLLISDLREEDEGDYMCSTEKEHRDITLYVKGCELVNKTVVEKVTGFIGESVVLPCSCTELQDDPKRVTWEFNKNNHFQEIYSKQTGHHSNRVKLVSKNPPGNLSLLITDLTEEDQGLYRCNEQYDSRDLSLSVKVRTRETSKQSRKPDTTPPPEQPQRKTTTSLPASSSTTEGGSVESSTEAGCALSVKNNTEITQYKGGSVLLPCSCSDLHYKPQKFTWETFRTGPLTEVLNDEHYGGRYQLFNNISPANLSLLISDLREEDQGYYRCSTGLQEYKDIRLNVKGCELVKNTVVEEVTGFTGESVVLPCVCADLQNDPKRVTWKFNKNNHFQEIYSKQTGNHSNRVKLVSKNPPGTLSLLISDLTEEDQGFYRCSAQDDHRDLRLSVNVGRRETSTQSRKTDKTSPSEHPQSKTTTSPPSSSTTQVGRKKPLTQWRKPNKTPPSEQPQSKTTTSPPASSLTTPEHDKQQPPFFGTVAVLLLVIPVVVAFICWRRKAGRSGENMITEGCSDNKGNPEDQTVPDVTYSTGTHINTAGAARVQINDGEETENASIITN